MTGIFLAAFNSEAYSARVLVFVNELVNTYRDDGILYPESGLELFKRKKIAKLHPLSTLQSSSMTPFCINLIFALYKSMR